jgi:phage baseplate assembly protein W
MTNGSYYFNDLNRYFNQTSVDIVEEDVVNAIEMDINNILECPLRSFMFNRDFGSRLRSFIFEPINDTTAAAIKIYLVEAISKWEPRVSVIVRDSYVTPDYDQNTYYVKLAYLIVNTGSVKQLYRTLATQTGQ